MILLDSNVLIALVDQRDPARERALYDLEKLESRGLLLTWPVATESLHFLKRVDQRRHLRELMEDLAIEFLGAPDQPSFDEVLNWMFRYGDQKPDLADAYLFIA
jgi:predicted nucleic acid-binding protein